MIVLACSAARGEDIHFLAEHLPEAAQDARYIALPWVPGPLEAGRSSFAVQLGWTGTSAGPLDLDGPMLGLAVRRAWSNRSGLLALGFVDAMKVSGPGGTEVLDLPFAPAGLGLPQQAALTDPRGTYRHWGVGAAWLRALGEERRATLGLGLLYDHLSMDGFAMDYRLLTGPAAGQRGVLDHSSRAAYLTPCVQLARTWSVGERFLLTPRLGAAVPLPAGDFDARLVGPGFDVTGTPAKIGDPVLGAAAGVLHRRSGLELDLGVTLAFPLVEHVSHPGVDRAWTAQLAWHSAGAEDRK